MRTSIRPRVGFIVVLVALLAALPGCADAGKRVVTGAGSAENQHGVIRPQAAGDNVAVQLNNAVVEAILQSALGDPAKARALAIVNTCMYDAWAAYDATAVGTRLGASLRRPAGERSLANQEKALSFAAYRAAVDLIPGSKGTIFDPLMTKLGYDPGDTSTSRATPSGIGNVACQAVLDFRRGDGANQLGNMPGGQPGVPYSDHTGYKPANDPMVLPGAFDPATLKDPARWQPLTYTDATGTTGTPEFLSPHWGKVVPFAMTAGSQFRPSGPVQPGTDPFKAQAQALLDLSASLTEQQRVIVKYWAEAPPPTLWNQYAQHVSRRNGHGRDLQGTAADVKMFFALSNAMFDASIAGWDSKAHFDYVRPITAIRSLFRGQKVRAWGGPGKGTQEINGEEWLPYAPSTFPTPPFTEYISGHSVFSLAGAEALKLITGSDNFGFSVTIKAGDGGYEPGVPAADLTLSWKTFTEAAEEASISRQYGGYHYVQGDLDGRTMGRQVAALALVRAQALFAGQGVDPAPGGQLPRTL